MKKACIIPAFNEEDTIRGVVTTALSCPDFDEVYLVDDGSADGTFDRVQCFEKRFEHFTIIRNSKNIGKTKSVINAVGQSDAELIVLLDGDLLNLDTSDLQTMIGLVEKGLFDMIILDRWASDRGSALHGWAGLVRIYSGERAFKKSDFMGIDFSRFVDHPYILENAMNLSFLERRLKIKNLSAKDLFAVSRRRKSMIAHPASGYLKMVIAFFRHVGILNILRQVVRIETDLLPFSDKRTGFVLFMEAAYSATILFPMNWLLNVTQRRRTTPSQDMSPPP